MINLPRLLCTYNTVIFVCAETTAAQPRSALINQTHIVRELLVLGPKEAGVLRLYDNYASGNVSKLLRLLPSSVY